MSSKSWIVDYLTFTRRERIGVLILLCLIITITLLPEFLHNGNIRSTPADTAWIAAVKKLEVREIDSNNRKPFNSRPDYNDNAYQYDRSVNQTSYKTLFYFDPNTLDVEGWKKLGLKDKTIHTIKNYLSKGGHFYKPEDLQRIYGLHANNYTRLEPFIKIESINIPARNEYVRKENESRRSYNTIDINTADTSAFIALPGIGNKLAVRIVNFREKLGGFYSVRQVGEVYGLADSVFQKIKQYLSIESSSVKKININTMTVDELKAHPYLKHSIANPIIAYRNEHGPFARLEDLREVMVVTDEVYNKILPYLTLQ